jgi:hypothetical protein
VPGLYKDDLKITDAFHNKKPGAVFTTLNVLPNLRLSEKIKVTNIFANKVFSDKHTNLFIRYEINEVL